jgi:hypothetical protein
MPPAGHTLFTPEIASEIIERLGSESLEKICKDSHLPSRQTIYNWQDANPSFLADCARARKRQAAAAEEKVREIAEKCEAGEIDPKAAGVAISAHQWRAKVIDPKQYGDRIQNAITDADGNAAGFVFGVIASPPKQIEDK